jgi:glycosyltransferase involved in cell wall biosynthesis
MKIAYVHDAVYPFIKGGAEKRMYELSRRLVKRGHEVHIYGMRWWKDKEMELEGIKLHGIGRPMSLYSGGRRSIGVAAIFAGKVFPEITKENFNVIDCYQAPYLHSFPTKLTSMIKSSPLVITWHEVWRGYWKEYLGSLGVVGRIMEKTILLGLADSVIAVSDQTRDDLMNLGVNPKKINVVPNGVDYSRIQKVKPAKEKSDIVYLGRLIKPKNIDVLIQAVSVLKMDFPDLKVSIIGSGPERKSLEQLAKKLKVQKNVKFHGFVEDSDEVISIMKASKIFVIPSIQEGGASIVTQEANACGLPVIAVDHPLGIDKRLILQGVNGFFVKLGPAPIAEKINSLLSSETSRKKVSKQALKLAEKWDWNNIVKTLEGVYGSLS